MGIQSGKIRRAVRPKDFGANSAADVDADEIRANCIRYAQRRPDHAAKARMIIRHKPRMPVFCKRLIQEIPYLRDPRFLPAVGVHNSFRVFSFESDHDKSSHPASASSSSRSICVSVSSSRSS